MKHLVLLLAALPALAQTNIATTSTVLTSNITPIGMNLGGWAYYDAFQYFKNIFASAPGFTNELNGSMIPCDTTANTTTCTTTGPQWASGYWAAGAPVRILQGPAAGCTTTVTSYSPPTLSYNALAGTSPVTGMACSSFAPTNYLYVYETVTPTIAGGAYNAINNWQNISSGTSPAFTLTSSVPTSPNSVDVYTTSLQMSATSPDVAGIQSTSDAATTLAGYNTLDLNGTYTVEFDYQLASGSTPGLIVSVLRGSTVYYTTTVTPGGSWAHSSGTFTASETGNISGQLYLRVKTNGNTEAVNVRNFTVHEATTAGNSTVFRDAVVNRLKLMKAGVIRDWDGSTNQTQTLDNAIMGQFARAPVGFGYQGGSFYYNVIQPSLGEFLNLCATVGASAWYVIPPSFSVADMQNLSDYLYGGSGTTYGAKRIAQGYDFSAIPHIYLELGNEQWNNQFGGGIAGAYNPAGYGVMADQLFSAMKAQASYNASRTSLVLGTQFAGTYYIQTIQAGSTHNDLIDGAPYFMAYINDVSIPDMPNTALAEGWLNVVTPVGSPTGGAAVCMENTNYSWEPVNGGIQTNCPVENTFSITGPGGGGADVFGGGPQSQNFKAEANTAHNVPYAWYEFNAQFLSSASLTQMQADQWFPSLTEGLMVANMAMNGMKAGVTVMNIFQFGQNYFADFGLQERIWGTVIDAGGPTNSNRPSFWAPALANSAIPGIGSSMITTTQTGTPTITIGSATASAPPYTNGSAINSVAGNNIPQVQSFAFNNGSNYGMVLFNTSGSGQAVTFSTGGVNPPSTVTLSRLTSANATDNNETPPGTTVVPTTPASTNISGGITLPAYSETAITWTSGSSAVVSVSPTSLSYGNQTVATTSAGQTVTVSNTGSSTANISSIVFTTGTQYAQSATTCGSTLAASATCTITITFTPTSTGSKTDTLTVNSDGGNPTVALSGTGVNSCTPLSLAATPGRPAIVNGIDALDWSVVRLQWTSSASATAQRIRYGTTSGVYTNIFNLPLSSAGTSYVQGSTLSNLLPSTTYYAVMESYSGGSWCTAPEVSFTTLARPAQPTLPTQPATFSTTRPTITGTDYTYGSTCGTSGAVATRLSDCFTQASACAAGGNNCGVGIPPGNYVSAPLFMPANPAAVSITCTATSPGVCTQTGTPPINGTKIRLGAYGGYPPTPLQSGVDYYVVGRSGSTFEISYDGTTALNFSNTGTAAIQYAPYPYATGWVICHSTASASALPPDGVRTDPSYSASSYPFILSAEINSATFLWPQLTSKYWFHNIGFGPDPSGLTAIGNGVDPPAFKTPWNSGPYNDSLVWDQVIINAPPPNRTFSVNFDGSNVGVLNSYILGLDFWQPFRAIGGATVTSTSITYPAGTFSYVGSAGTKQTCTYSGGSLTTTGGSGAAVVYVDPSGCAMKAILTTGVTSTSSNITATTAGTPAFPTYTWTPSIGGLSSYTGLNVLTMATFNITSGTISGYNELAGISSQTTESGQGITTGLGPGPIMVVNNYISGGGIVGTFMTDGMYQGGSPCGTLCQPSYSPGNLTEQRNTITTEANKNYGSSSWNGGDYSWRNMSETKFGKIVRQDGNIYGPFYSQIGPGECIAHSYYIPGTFPFSSGVVNYTDSSEWTFTNNTCTSATGISMASSDSYQGYSSGMPMRDTYIHNNLFLLSGYGQSFPPGTPIFNGFAKTQGSTSCASGEALSWGQNGENWLYDHNTVYGLSGCTPGMFIEYATLSGGESFTNNLLALVSDTPGPYGGLIRYGTYFNSYQSVGATPDTPDCSAGVANVLIGCLTNFNWAGNAIIGYWTNPFPGSLVDYTSAQITTALGNLPSSLAPSGASLANRITSTHWFDPTNSNFRLNYQSPFISGANVTTDGLDVGVDQDALDAAQGKVSNVHAFSLSSTGATIGFLAPDAFACAVDYDTTGAFTPGAFTRVAGSGGQRVQNVAISGLTAHGLYHFRVDCAASQPQLTVQLP